MRQSSHYRKSSLPSLVVPIKQTPIKVPSNPILKKQGKSRAESLSRNISINEAESDSKPALSFISSKIKNDSVKLPSLKRFSSVISLQSLKESLAISQIIEDKNITAYLVKGSVIELEPCLKLLPPLEASEKQEKDSEGGYYFKINGGDSLLLRSVLSANGFRETGNNNSFTILWSTLPLGKEAYNNLKYYQKANHFPKSQELCKRDSMYTNISKMQILHGFLNFDIVPKTYILPNDMPLLEKLSKDYDKVEPKWYIVRPIVPSKDKKSFITNNLEKIWQKRETASVVSHYISNPFMINGSKFELEVYVAITSIDPLRIYMFKEGRVKFNKDSNERLPTHMRNKSAPQIDTNSSNKEKETPNDFNFSSLKDHLKSKGFDPDAIFKKIEDLIIKAILSVESIIFRAASLSLPRQQNCFDFISFNLLLDDKLKPWLLDVNYSPNLDQVSSSDFKFKSEMVTDLMNLVGFVPNQQRKVQKSDQTCGIYSHAFVIQETIIKKTSSISSLKPIEVLSKEERLVVEETNREWERRGKFKRIFPNEDVHTYANFFEAERKYNILLRRMYIIRYHYCKDLNRIWMNTTFEKLLKKKNAVNQNSQIYSERRSTASSEFRNVDVEHLSNNED